MTDTSTTDFQYRQLPPDPDGMNEECANWALGAVQEFIHLTGSDSEDALSDLLCDLMHLSDRREPHLEDFENAPARARAHYEAAQTASDHP